MSYPPPPHFPPRLPPQPPPRRHTTTALTRTLGVLFLVVLVGGYAAAVLLTRHVWDDREATRITYATVTSDGAPASPDALAKVRDVVEKRLYGIGFSGSEVKIDNDTVVVTIPSRDPDTVRDIAMPGRLTIRPVVHAMAAKTGPQTQPPAPGGHQTLSCTKDFRREEAAAEHQPVDPDPGAAVPGHPLRR
ncbi:MAG: hypothetical protein WBB05_26300 [Mycolicibacterium fortuitum]|uniref:hypothetical protein n=1 Tax=Mycolicibacterium fortuitum TaxID=1766 RepID=UPI001CDD447F|nr:hypothetical protein [Mycolicibacterium fortuitum]UBV18096.1 hypothetical protein H8Z57_15680 [Mycolicibacterium fortuitum]